MESGSLLVALVLIALVCPVVMWVMMRSRRSTAERPQDEGRGRADRPMAVGGWPRGSTLLRRRLNSPAAAGHPLRPKDSALRPRFACSPCQW